MWRRNSKAARRIPREIWPVARKLDRVKAAADLTFLTDPPANRLEALKGDQNGRHSIRVNDQYRVTRWRAVGGQQHGLDPRSAVVVLDADIEGVALLEAARAPSFVGKPKRQLQPQARFESPANNVAPWPASLGTTTNRHVHCGGGSRGFSAGAGSGRFASSPFDREAAGNLLDLKTLGVQ